MSDEQSIAPFGTYKLPFPFSLIRKKAMERSGKSFYSETTRRAAKKIFRRAFDINWDGIKIRLYPHLNATDNSIFCTGVHRENRDFEYLKERYGNKNIIYIDIGGNVGTHSLYLWKILDKKSTIVTYEPSPSLYDKLLVNLKFNHAESIKTLNVGIGPEEGSFWLYQTNVKDAGTLSLVPTHKDGEKFKIEVVKLADSLKSMNISKIDLLKIDIEGYEDQALLPYLKSCEATTLPKHIMIENNKDQWQEDCFSYLEERGYELVKRFGANHHFLLKER